jgi:hypothetical protein
MAAIKILDDLSAELIVANPPSLSGLGKYLKTRTASLTAGPDLKLQLPKHLHEVSPGDNGFTLSFDKDVPLGASGTTLTVSAKSTSVIGVLSEAGTPLFEDAFLGPPVTVPAGRAYVSFSFHPTLTAGLKQKVGALGFGFDAGSDVQVRCYRPFDISGEPVTLLEACRESLESFAVPNTADDLQAMKALPVGTIATVSGHGHLQISGSADVAAAFNPLAGINTIAALGTLNAGGTASASLGFDAKLSGDLQLRVERMNGSTIRLSYHKVASRELDLTVDVTANPTVTLGERDLLNMLLRGPGGSSTTAEAKPDEDLSGVGISAAQQKRLTAEMQAGMSRRMDLALHTEFASMRQDEAAFLYEIDVDALDEVGLRALNGALAGNLIELTRLEPTLPAHGLSVLQSRTQALRRKQITWRVNLVGLVNLVSLTELVRTGSVFHDEDSGELVITDKVTTTRMGSATVARNLRKLLFESVMITATYKAGGLDPNTSLSATQTFFTLDRHANRHRMSDYLDAAAAVGLLGQDDIPGALGTVDDFGRASLQLETVFDQAACERLFGDDGAPRDRGFYEDVGKLALLALVQERDADAYRRIPLRDAALWQRMKTAGATRFRFLLPSPITGGSPEHESLHVQVVVADYTMIVWWAEAMASASAAIADLRAYLTGPPRVAPDEHDPEFTKRRTRVSEAMVKAVQKNRTSFGRDPWGLVAMFYAAKRSGAVKGAVVSPSLTRFLPG